MVMPAGLAARRDLAQDRLEAGAEFAADKPAIDRARMGRRRIGRQFRDMLDKLAALNSAGHPPLLRFKACVHVCRSLPGWRRCPKGEGHAGPDLSQPALQHLAQDPGPIAREGGRTGDRRVSEDTLHSGAAEDLARPAETAGEGAAAKERSG